MKIEVIDTLPGLEQLRPQWLVLWQSCPTATPFQAPQWLLPWTRYIFGGGQIWALAIRDGGELIGFAPLFRWGIHRRTVSLLGAGISDYGDLLFAPDREAECVAGFRDVLSADRDWDVLDLQELRCGSGLLDRWQAEVCSICPVLELNTFPGSMDDKHRTDVRRARNKLLRRPDVDFSIANEGTLTRYLGQFFRLHEARRGKFNDALERFHREVAQEFLTSGHLRLSLLRIGDAAAAAIYAFVCRKTLYCYLSGFDPVMAKSSPGSVLLGWVIDQAIVEGMEEVDFLRQGEAYKYLWGARDRQSYAVRRKRDDLSW